jgi:CBS-domain-containing membrane protein
LIARAVTLFGKDTVLKALDVMKNYSLRRLPVVDDLEGQWLGEVTVEELYRWWATAPLTQVWAVLAARVQQVCEL